MENVGTGAGVNGSGNLAGRNFAKWCGQGIYEKIAVVDEKSIIHPTPLGAGHAREKNRGMN